MIQQVHVLHISQFVCMYTCMLSEEVQSVMFYPKFQPILARRRLLWLEKSDLCELHSARAVVHNRKFHDILVFYQTKITTNVKNTTLNTGKNFLFPVTCALEKHDVISLQKHHITIFPRMYMYMYRVIQWFPFNRPCRVMHHALQ